MNMSKFGQIDLHLHLDGSLPAETILRIAKEEGIRLPADSYGLTEAEAEQLLANAHFAAFEA